MKTHTTTRPARKVNLTAALASAEDDFTTECYAFYEVPTGSISRDLLDMEVVARMTLNYAAGIEKLLAGMEYGACPERHGFQAALLDLISDQMQHGAGAVVAANLAKMESE